MQGRVRLQAFVDLLLQVHGNGPVLDDEILADPEVQEAIKNEGHVHKSYDIFNTDRATLGRVGGAIARLHGDSGFAGTVSIELQVQCQQRAFHTSNLCVEEEWANEASLYDCHLALRTTLQCVVKTFCIL